MCRLKRPFVAEGSGHFEREAEVVSRLFGRRLWGWRSYFALRLQVVGAVGAAVLEQSFGVALEEEEAGVVVLHPEFRGVR